MRKAKITRKVRMDEVQVICTDADEQVQRITVRIPAGAGKVEKRVASAIPDGWEVAKAKVIGQSVEQRSMWLDDFIEQSFLDGGDMESAEGVSGNG